MPLITYANWRDLQAKSKYPFKDTCKLTNGTNFIPTEMVLDAKFYIINTGSGIYLSKVTVTVDDVTIYLSSGNTIVASASFDIGSAPTDLLFYDNYNRKCGMLVCNSSILELLTGWGVGDHTFIKDNTEFVESVITPMPQVGVKSVRCDTGDIFTNVVYLIGKDGVFLSLDEGAIRVDIVGDVRPKQKLCSDLGIYNTPRFITSINNQPVSGDFKFLASNHYASDTILRLEPSNNKIVIKLAK